MTTRDHGPGGLVLMRGDHTDVITIARGGNTFASCSAGMALALGAVPYRDNPIPLTPEQLQWLASAVGKA